MRVVASTLAVLAALHAPSEASNPSDGSDGTPRVAPATAAAPPRWPAFVGLGAAIAGLGASLYFGDAALKEQDRAASGHYFETDPRLLRIRDSFDRDRVGWIAGLGLAGVGTAFVSYWFMARMSPHAPTIQATLGDRVSISLTWEIGGRASRQRHVTSIAPPASSKQY